MITPEIIPLLKICAISLVVLLANAEAARQAPNVTNSTLFVVTNGIAAISATSSALVTILVI